MAEGNRLLQIQDLTAWYDPGRPVLSGLSLELGEREAVGLIGLNGAGNTTLMSLLSGLHEGFTMAGIKAKENPFREYLAYVFDAYGKRRRISQNFWKGSILKRMRTGLWESFPWATGKHAVTVRI